ncbi:hypothetical protein AMECASPLE_001111 [Ameca splendens]|uniref:Uncharacterized protein n=1 Tax=Ameca splendens TaxID=208324 RepID=A0ABV1A6U1_9TELE
MFKDNVCLKHDFPFRNWSPTYTSTQTGACFKISVPNTSTVLQFSISCKHTDTIFHCAPLTRTVTQSNKRGLSSAPSLAIQLSDWPGSHTHTHTAAQTGE